MNVAQKYHSLTDLALGRSNLSSAYFSISTPITANESQSLCIIAMLSTMIDGAMPLTEPTRI